jgi:hypothetical protein
MNLTILQAQQLFANKVARLLNYAINNNIDIVIGEVARTIEQQKINVKNGVSKTLDSYHLKKCAIDILIFKNNIYSQNSDDYKPLAIFWESLHENNRAGYFWGWDLGHFETHSNTAPKGA